VETEGRKDERMGKGQLSSSASRRDPVPGSAADTSRARSGIARISQAVGQGTACVKTLAAGHAEGERGGIAKDQRWSPHVRAPETEYAPPIEAAMIRTQDSAGENRTLWPFPRMAGRPGDVARWKTRSSSMARTRC